MTSAPRHADDHHDRNDDLARHDVSRRLHHWPPSDPPDPEIVFVSGAIEDAVAAAREAAEGKNVGIFGANVAAQVIAAGLLDEIVAHVVPVLLGDGVRLYGGGAADPTVRLERVDATLSPQITDLRLRVVR